MKHINQVKFWNFDLKTKIVTSEYTAPYAHFVNDQPSKEMMRSIVTRYRPEIRECYQKDESAVELVRIITLGWDKDPEARISAASMVNRLKNLISRRNTE